MTKQLQNELSDAQLDAISGGSYSRGCNEGYGRNKKWDEDCGERKYSCDGEYSRKHHRDNDDCGREHRKYRGC